MKVKKFEIISALKYAHKWALLRNPQYYNFELSNFGGDCTNFVSQCIYAGSATMNTTKHYGWYYRNINDRSPSWTGTQPLYNFLIGNKGLGPFGKEIAIQNVKPGAIIQLSFDNIVFSHSLIVLKVGKIPRPDNILIACHTKDALLKPLSEYFYQRIRFIEIVGIKVT